MISTVAQNDLNSFEDRVQAAPKNNVGKSSKEVHHWTSVTKTLSTFVDLTSSLPSVVSQNQMNNKASPRGVSPKEAKSKQ